LLKWPIFYFLKKATNYGIITPNTPLGVSKQKKYMKKILFALIAVSLVFGTFAMAKEGENKADKPNTIVEVNKNQEKITSPSELDHFSNIIKKGKDLYGMRKIVLEKITHPSEIVNFENIKKMGTALWGMRKEDNQTLVRPEAVTCVKAAIDKKDASIKTGIATGATNLTALVDARNVCQKAALDLTTVKEQKDANKLCIETYKKAIESGRETVKKSQATIWKTFKDDLKTCGQLQKAAGGAEEIKLEDGGLGMEL